LKGLYENKNLFLNAFHYASIGMAIVSLDGKWLKVNQSICRLLGYSESELQQMNFQDITYSEDLNIDLLNVKKMLSGELQYYEMEKRYIHKNGSIVWGLLSVSLVKDEQAQPLYFISQIQDITKQQELTAKLEKSEENYRSVVEFYPEGLFVYGKEKLRFINENIVKLLGAAHMHEILEQPLIHFIHPSDHKRVIKAIDLILKKKIPVPITDQIKYIRKDGIVKIGELSITTITYDYETCILGAIRDITKQREVANNIREINKKLKEMSKMDGLTSIPNRRYFDEMLTKEGKRASINSTPLSLIMLDVDFFKPYNDTYGHHRGDECLKIIAKTLYESVKSHKDFVARYGGEEFSIILPETNETGALITANRLCSIIENLNIPHSGSNISPYVTVSLGVTTIIPTPQTHSQQFIEIADKALYAAKDSGRNQVAVYRDFVNHNEERSS